MYKCELDKQTNGQTTISHSRQLAKCCRLLRTGMEMEMEVEMKMKMGMGMTRGKRLQECLFQGSLIGLG